jgi:hypothetical protein
MSPGEYRYTLNRSPGPARTTQTARSCAARAGYATAPSTCRCTSAINPAGSAARPAASPNTDDSTGQRSSQQTNTNPALAHSANHTTRRR